ncbi:MAG: hypothetical protein ACI97A_002131 [Planctomycetota bacterium]|jgi:hypothetical protein
MKNPSKAVDQYIAKSPEFAQPILEKIRKAVHKACPNLDEVMKWSVPHFEVDGLLCSMSFHKAHVRLSFWKGTLLEDPQRLLESHGNTGMSGMKIETLKDLPTQKILVAYVKEAATLNANNEKSKPTKAKVKAERKDLVAPDDLAAALKKSKKALATFEGFSPTHKREYVEWITEAKREGTREKRLVQAIEWMAEGKPRNWKYMKW